MKDSDYRRFAGYLTYGLFCSAAYRTMNPAFKDILHLVYFEIKLKSYKRTPYKQTIINQSDIKMPYTQIKDILGYSERTCWAAFKEFQARGFLEVVAYGGGGRGDFQVYKIVEGWRRWTPGTVIKKARKSGNKGWQKNNKTGLQEEFKKAENQET